METNTEMAQAVTLNQWEILLDSWCPAQIYYYFKDSEGDRWCIYLRWRHQDPWAAELVHCDEEWECQWDHPDTLRNLLEEKKRTPGIITGYYTDEEYPALMEKALELVKGLNPKFKNI